jgi:RHH-type proline utilization regulon transcriptional repressor/proline dehydrogenase/delta 1-pyrroline-5-carboxylate dehydrogenase
MRRTHSERANRKRFARLFAEPSAIDVTITLTDEVMRASDQRRAASIFRRAATRATTKGFGAINAFGLKCMLLLSWAMPSAVVAGVHQRIRQLSRDLILASEPRALHVHLRHRKQEHLNLNINVLGEAVLGEAEASARFHQVLEMIARPEVDYVSVKLSSVVSQMNTIDHAGSQVRISARLRELYQAAQANNVFVNLDMEEYRDLRLTLDAFTNVLTEPSFHDLSAGIVLQAYLPESHAAMEELIAFAHERVASGGSPIKVRIVKGANLAMEHAEAELHGFVAAPYGSKADVDASYLRLLDRALRPEHADSLRIGVASHNLFHLSFALELLALRGVRHQVDIEMLEGMANAEALTFASEGLPVVLYAPVTRRDDFAAAVAYLVRRLDENTSPENYLRAAFTIDHDVATFDEQARRFTTAWPNVTPFRPNRGDTFH